MVVLHEPVDLIHKLLDASEGPAADGSLGDQVEPGTARLSREAWVGVYWPLQRG